MAGKMWAVAGTKTRQRGSEGRGTPSHPIHLRRRLGQAQDGMKQEGRGWVRLPRTAPPLHIAVVQRDGALLDMYFMMVDKENEP